MIKFIGTGGHKKTFNGFIGHYFNKLGRHLNLIIKKDLKINMGVCVYMKDAGTVLFNKEDKKKGKQRKISEQPNILVVDACRYRSYIPHLAMIKMIASQTN